MASQDDDRSDDHSIDNIINRWGSDNDKKRGRRSTDTRDVVNSFNEFIEGSSRPQREESVSSRASTHSRRSIDRSPSRPLLHDQSLQDDILQAPPSHPQSDPPAYWDIAGQPPNIDQPPIFTPPTTEGSEADPQSGSYRDAPVTEQQSRNLREPESPYRDDPDGSANNVFSIRDAPTAIDRLLVRNARRRNRVKRCFLLCCGCCCNGNLLGKSLAILCTVVIIVLSIVGSVLHFRPERPSPHWPDHKLPDPDTDPDFSDERCGSATLSTTAGYSFNDISNFTFTQSPFSHNLPIDVRGTIKLGKKNYSSKEQINVVLSMRYSDGTAPPLLNYQPQDGIIDIGAPNNGKGLSQGSSTRDVLCIDATIYVRSSFGDLDQISIASQDLDVIVFDQQTFVSNSLSIFSNHGKIESAADKNVKNIRSREIVLSTDSGRIEGTYPLYDLLKITSKSGAIEVKVDAKAAGKIVKPAQLRVASNSGKADLSFLDQFARPGWKFATFAERDYQISVETDSGQVQLNPAPHGSMTSIKSSSAQVKARLSASGKWHYGDNSRESSIEVVSSSGQIEFDLVASSAYWARKGLKNLSASFSHKDGQLKASFPGTWQGKLDGYTRSGAVEIDWPGLHYSRERGGSGYEHIHGKVGDGNGNGTLYFKGSSGRVELTGRN